MERKVFLALLLINFSAYAQVSEEAVILNQELQLLEERANNIQIISATPTLDAPSRTDRPSSLEESLERRYFAEDREDQVSTKAAAPLKRRSADGSGNL